MALGAHRSDVFRMVLCQGIKMAGIGIIVGMTAVFVLVPMLPSFSHLLYGIQSDDPLTLVAVSACMIFIALLACYVPARRAMRTDPMVSLRRE
jgi:ABC-type antimicrobial peptide transport system permease subunit